MKYTIFEGNIYIANEETLSRYYDTEVLDLPEDYERGKYIVIDNALVLNPNWDEQSLKVAQENKYNEANQKAKDYIESGEALFEFEEGKHVEATDGNIGKFTAYALAFVTGQLKPTDTVVWNTKEDETVYLTSIQVSAILNGLGAVQSQVWTVKFPNYVQEIYSCETAEEVNAIVINYGDNNG